MHSMIYMLKWGSVKAIRGYENSNSSFLAWALSQSKYLRSNCQIFWFLILLLVWIADEIHEGRLLESLLTKKLKMEFIKQLVDVWLHKIKTHRN